MSWERIRSGLGEEITDKNQGLDLLSTGYLLGILSCTENLEHERESGFTAINIRVFICIDGL